jgi:hypothetical protein
MTAHIYHYIQYHTQYLTISHLSAIRQYPSLMLAEMDLGQTSLPMHKQTYTVHNLPVVQGEGLVESKKEDLYILVQRISRCCLHSDLAPSIPH